MPEISGLLILILIFGFNFLRKRLQQTSGAQTPSKPQTTYQPAAMPAFPEASPTLPAKPPPIAKNMSVPKRAIPVPSGTPMEGETLDWKLEKRETPMSNPFSDPKPKSRVVPLLTKDSLVRGVVLHEILTRPKHAVAPYLKDYPPRV